ncbi:MAG: CvpA family protein [Anaerolineae bacterium]|jgi:uncharacterized membrane protein required for colicin V production
MVTWNVNHYLFLGLILGAFGFIGFRRGAKRELLSLVGIVLGILVAKPLAVMIQPRLNHFYRLARFALSGGLSSPDPMATWTQIRQSPGLVHTAQQQVWLQLAIFGAIVLIFFFIGQGRISKGGSLVPNTLGLFVGAVNGFLFAYYLLPLLMPAPQTVIALETGSARQALTEPEVMARMVVFLVMAVIAFGLYSATGGGKK